MMHDELIDGVIDDFFEHDIDPVVGMRSIAEPADVHPRAEPDMGQASKERTVLSSYFLAMRVYAISFRFFFVLVHDDQSFYSFG